MLFSAMVEHTLAMPAGALKAIVDGLGVFDAEPRVYRGGGTCLTGTGR